MTNLRKLTLVAVLSAVSFLLMLYQFSIGIEFFKLDFSILPILLALVLFDLKSATAVLLIRSVLKLALNGQGVETLIGLPINIVAVLVFIAAFAMIWKKRSTVQSFILAGLVGTVLLTITMLLVNYFYAIPLYATFANTDIEKMVGIFNYLVTLVIPFNLLEGVIWSATFWVVYTLLRPVLKQYEE
ncbi:ECF transporter S component [Streptococcus sp. DD13]|uniref:ECF transporter S component n=1 Tax=Streptococcus sp. DD13 TaxID=1777881 RepID=UPI000795C149|nr:ECF transporter S component [Streptococcus sp. DD13]KXT78266.1 Substrate-specific component RibU of riboflavin ECF transporter [Streptococcus sp. DD13]